jgi:CelD/BcsL family acetyltransferase involved in cellulose biosynthesis
VNVDASVVRTVEAFAALAGEWDALAARHRQPLVEHDWFLSCASTLHRPDALRVVVLREDGVLCAAAPLAVRREHGIERLEILGMRALHEPSGLIYRDEAALAALLDAVRRLGRPVVLQRVDEAGPVERVARDVLASRSWLLGRTTGPTVRVPLEADWATFQARLSGRLRKWLRRARTLAEAEGMVRIEKIVPEAAAVDAHLAAFAALEAAGWKGRRQSALLMKAALGAFFADYVRRAAERGTLRVWYLHVGPRLAAAQISLEAHTVVWVLKIAYDEGLARLSPGLQLTSAMLEDAVRLRLSACEFIGSADDWKQRWRGELRPLRLLLIYPRSLRGAAALAADVIAHAARALRERLTRPTASAAAAAAEHGPTGAEPAGGRA